MKKTGAKERPSVDKIYRAIKESRGDLAIASFKPDGIITFANNFFCSLYDKKQGDIPGSNIFDYAPEKVHGKIRGIFRSPENDHISKNGKASTFTVTKGDRKLKWMLTLFRGTGRGKAEALAVIHNNPARIKKNASGPMGGTDLRSIPDKNQNRGFNGAGPGRADNRAGDINNIKHGLRSHLNVIIGYSQYLAKSDNITEAQKKQIGMIQDNGYYLINWIDEIFDKSRTGGSLITEVYPPESPPRAPVNITGYAGDVKRVLIVDDWEAARIFLSDLLSSVGFEIAEAVNGADCLLKIDSFRPHAVLLDLIMPVIGGLEIMKELKAGDKLKDMKVIMVTANDSQEVREMSMESGCADFITKPIKFDDLFQKLEKHLSLTWLYDGGKGPAPGDEVRDEDIAPPPSEMLKPLYDAALMYDYRAMLKKADEIEKSDVKFVPFTERIKSLAEKFEMIEITGFIRRFME